MQHYSERRTHSLTPAGKEPSRLIYRGQKNGILEASVLITPDEGLISYLGNAQIQGVTGFTGEVQIRYSLGHEAYRQFARLALSGIDFSAQPGKESEFALLLRQAATDRTWGLDLDARNPASEEIRSLLIHWASIIEDTTATPVVDRTSTRHLAVIGSNVYHQTRNLLAKGQFQGTTDTWPTAFMSGRDFKGSVQLRHGAFEDAFDVSWEVQEKWREAMWKQVKELDDKSADAMDLLSAIWIERSTAGTLRNGKAIVEVDELLRRRGIKPKRNGHGRRGGFTPAQRMQMIREISHIFSIWFELTEMDVTIKVKNRRKRTKLDSVQSRAFMVTDLKGQKRLDDRGYMDIEVFLYTPGEVFSHYLAGPGRQVALLSSKALEYNPQKQAIEKRLARYLSWQWRSVASSGTFSKVYRIRTLLDSTGLDTKKRYPSKTRERLEKALDQLQGDGVIQTWEYVDWDEDCSNQKKWIRRWQETKVRILAPELIRTHYQTIASPSDSRASTRTDARAIEPPKTMGDEVRSRRGVLGMNQKDLADLLGVSQSYVSLIERGRVTPETLGTQVREALMRWLGRS